MKKHGSLEAFQRTVLERTQQSLAGRKFSLLYPHYLKHQALDRIAYSMEASAVLYPKLLKALTEHLPVPRRTPPCDYDYATDLLLAHDQQLELSHETWLEAAADVCVAHPVLRNAVAGGPYISLHDYMDVCVRLHNWLSHHGDLIPAQHRSSHMQLIYRYLASALLPGFPVTVDSLVTSGIVLIQRFSRAWACWTASKAKLGTTELYNLDAFQ